MEIPVFSEWTKAWATGSTLTETRVLIELQRTVHGEFATGCLPEAVVLFTSKDATQIVIAQAARWIRRNRARLRILVMQVVPFPEILTQPTRIDPNIGIAEELAKESAIEDITIAVYLCRNVIEGFRCAVDRQTPVFMGAKGHSWRTREWRLARKLQHCGYLVCCVDVQTAKTKPGTDKMRKPVARPRPVATGSFI